MKGIRWVWMFTTAEDEVEPKTEQKKIQHTSFIV